VDIDVKDVPLGVERQEHVRDIADTARGGISGIAWLPRPVWLLGFISLFTDAASEAIYPLLPLFLTVTLGAGVVSIGIVEGVAESISSLLRIVSGRLSDRWQQRRSLVRVGYTLSTFVRPLIGLATSWTTVLALRGIDRVGKGIRGAPRDAWLADVADPRARGRVFGFHRAMDHAGAIVGPLLAAGWLMWRPGDLKGLFLATVPPGAVVLWLLLRLPPDPARSHASTPVASSPQWRNLPRDFWRLMFVLTLFTLGNSTDAYLLLQLSHRGAGVVAIPVLWALLHVVKAGASIAGGMLADRFGRRPAIMAGWVLYAAVYAGFAIVDTAAGLVALFLVYGGFYGLTEGAERALVADVVPASLRGAAFGLYQATLGVGSLCASILFGLIWQAAGPTLAFSTGAVLALIAAITLPLFVGRAQAPRAA
jgi:MFS family permease